MALRGARADALLVLVAAALVALWFVAPQGTADDPLSMTDWSDVAEGACSDLVVRRGNARIAVRIERESPTGRRYTVRDHPQAAADPAALDRLIHAMAHLQALRVVDAPRSQFGLDHPSIEIELSVHADKRRILLGAAAPSPIGARYAEIVRNDRHHLVALAPATAQALDIEPEALLEHRVLGWLPSELQRIESSDALGPLVLERTDNGQWQLSHASHARANRNTTKQLLLALTELSLNRFLEPAPAAKALQTGPVSQLTLEAKREGGQEAVRLKLGGECPGQEQATVLFLEGSRALSGCVDAATLPKLTLDRAALVDDGAFSLRADEVERLEVAKQGQRWSLARKDAAFQLTTTTESSVTLGAGNALLGALTKLRGEPSGTCDFQQRHQGTTLSLRSFVVGDNTPSTEQIQVFPLGGDGRRRLCRDDGVELWLATEDAQLVEVEPTLLRDPELLDLPIEAITEVRLETPVGRQLLRKNSQGELLLVEPKSQQADVAAIETLRERLANLRAERWLTRTVPAAPKTRVSNASVEFTVHDDANAAVPAQSTRHRLALSLDESAPTLGWLDADPSPFQLEPALAELLDGLLLDRSLLRLRDADRTVTLSRGPDQIQLLQRETRWDLAKGPPGLDAASVVAALENLRAIAVYGSLLESPTRPTATARGAALRIEYFGEQSSPERPRLRFEIGARFKRHGLWVRHATIAESRLTFILRDEDLRTIHALFRAQL